MNGATSIFSKIKVTCQIGMGAGSGEGLGAGTT